MAKTIATTRILPSALRHFKNSYKEVIKDVSNRATVILIRNSVDDVVPITLRNSVVGEIGTLIERVFVGADGRNAFAEDGYTPLSAYAALLNESIVEVTLRTVMAHRDWLKRQLPEDVFGYLESAIRVDPVSEATVFKPRPFAGYDAAHTWVDPSGYTLSDRIWRTGTFTRQQIDAMVSEGIREGTGALELARQLERFLQPDQIMSRTKKPYGTDASYSAIRLARTELAHAFNEAALIAAQLNPFVEKMDIARSARGDPKCAICARHATIDISGNRVKEPIPLDEIKVPPFHPNDMCNVRAYVDTDTKDIVAQLRSYMGMPNVQPHINPTRGVGFVRQLLNRALDGVIHVVARRLGIL